MPDKLEERLREQAQALSGEAWRRTDGGLELCLDAILATEAADVLAAKQALIDELVADMLRMLHGAVDSPDYTEEELRSLPRWMADLQALISKARSSGKAGSDA